MKLVVGVYLLIEEWVISKCTGQRINLINEFDVTSLF